MKSITPTQRLASYPDAVVGFIIRLGDRYRDVQDWLNASPDGHRDDDLVWFTSFDTAEAFIAAFPHRLLETVEPIESPVMIKTAPPSSTETVIESAHRAHVARGINRAGLR